MFFYFSILKKDFIYSPETGRGRSRLHVGSPMWDSIPGPPGSHPEPKADTQPLSHPGVPRTFRLLPSFQAYLAIGYTLLEEKLQHQRA